METVNHPQHYGGADNPYEAIKVIEAWSLGFCLGNAIKYICRAGKKKNRHSDKCYQQMINTHPSQRPACICGFEYGSAIEDLKKAAWYLNREIERLSSGSSNEG